ncbi:MAG TPA: L,D-transpeptidase family protein [Hyphomicrobium sp.]|nr:L,D-transpeptidase family protein [Hyphomicrobium sp.]
MRVKSYLAVLALAALTAGTAEAQTESAGTASPSAVPTVTIINKAPDAPSQPAAPPTLTVTPDAPAPASPSTPEVPSSPEAPAAPSSPEAPGSAATSPAPDAPSSGEAAAAGTAASEMPAPPPEPTLAIDIDLTKQVMTVTDNGEPRYTWPISSARYGYRTPTGTFQPSWMSKMWYSRQYDYAPMPHAIFFHQGVAIHATYATRQLGMPASHGCVRLAPKNAATLYRMVNAHGKDKTRIVVHGTPDHSGARIASGERNDVVRMRRAYRYLPPSEYRPGAYSAYAAQPRYYAPRRGYAQPRRYQPRGLYNSYSYGYGF